MKKKQNIICPECNTENNIKQKTCVNCGKKLKRKNKAFLLLPIILVIFIAIIGLGINQLQISNSEKSFSLAKEYEENFEFENAIEHYSKVIEKDIENYAVAKTKISDLEEEIIEYKLCAKAILAANTTTTFDQNQIKEIYFAKPDSSYNFLYGKDTVTIVANYMSTDCCFIVSQKHSPLITNEYPVTKDSLTNLYVHQIGVEDYQQGWLSSSFQAVTNTYIGQAKTYCTKMNTDSVKKYLDEYYSTKDLKSISR